MNRVSTGIASLDRILQGGFTPGSFAVIAGAPGTGKTVLAQQLSYSLATQEHPALYYTTLSEPHSKLIRHIEGFGFFDPIALGSRVHFLHLSHSGEGQGGFDEFAAEVLRKSFEVSPSIVVVDSSKVLHEALSTEAFRRGVYELASRMAHTESVLVFVGEYALEELATAPEFAVADAIIYLANEEQGFQDARRLRVLKLRGSSFIGGRHAFAITDDGFDAFPRLETFASSREQGGTGRLSSGNAELDVMLGGGLPAVSATLVAGPSGVGKTVVALGFVSDGLARGEKCLYITFQEGASQLVRKAEGLGLELASHIESGRLQVVYVEPVEMGIDIVGGRLRDLLRDFQPVRVVVDSVTEIEHAAAHSGRYGDYLWALVHLLQAAGATTILTNETAAFFGPAFELAGGVSYVFDNVLLLRYTELESQIRRALTVVKMRDSDHVKNLVEFEITSKGVAIGASFVGMTGVLTGTPVPTVEKRFGEFFGR